MAIWTAARSGDLEAVREALAEGADLSSRDAEGYLPAARAIQGRHADVLRILLEHGADPAAVARIEPDRHPRVMYADTPLIVFAAAQGGVEVVRVLLEAGTDPNQHDAQVSGPPRCSVGPWTTSPLLEAARAGDVDVVRLLVEAGADLDEGCGPCDELTGETALMHALGNDRGMFGALLSLGADPQRPREDGLLPTVVAATLEDSTWLEMLLDAGADPSRACSGRYYEGRCPLIAAVEARSEPAIRLLLARGAEPPRASISD